MPANARDVLKSLIWINPLKSQQNDSKDVQIARGIASQETLFSFDDECSKDLVVLLDGVLPDTKYIFQFASRFGTSNVLVTVNNKPKFEESYYLTSGILFGVVGISSYKYNFEARIRLDKSGYKFNFDPINESRHLGVQSAREISKMFLYKLYRCE